MGEDTVSIKEAAGLLKVSRGTIYRMIGDGRLQAVTRGHLLKGKHLIVRASLERYLSPTELPRDSADR